MSGSGSEYKIEGVRFSEEPSVEKPPKGGMVARFGRGGERTVVQRIMATVNPDGLRSLFFVKTTTPRGQRIIQQPPPISRIE